MTPARALFIGTLYAGHRTRFSDLRAYTAADTRIRPEYRTVSGWRPDGLLERLAPIPRPLRGRVRALWEGASLARLPRPDVIWTSLGDELLVPYAWAQIGPLRRPLVVELDSTRELLDASAELYFGRPPRRGVRLQVARLREHLAYAGVTHFIAWSRWAAAGLERLGVPPERVRVLPPGVDLDRWRFVPRQPASRVRLLFVGGDFERKGGHLLLEVVRSRLRGLAEVDIVTRSAVPPGNGWRVHRAGPSSPLLHRLFAEADVFVLPTRAECFGIAAVEAMASGLPVVMGDVGAAREIIDHGETGWVVPPRACDLAAALGHVVQHARALPAMGRRARAVAERRYDARRNAREVVDTLLQVRERWTAGAAALQRG